MLQISVFTYMLINFNFTIFHTLETILSDAKYDFESLKSLGTLDTANVVHWIQYEIN